MKLKLLLAALAISTAPLGARESLSIQVTPHFSFAPANLRVVARLTPDFENRVLTIVADSPQFYRSSEIQLEGDRAPRAFHLMFPGVPSGEYDVTAVVMDSRGEQRIVAHRQVVVLPVTGVDER